MEPKCTTLQNMVMRHTLLDVDAPTHACDLSAWSRDHVIAMLHGVCSSQNTSVRLRNQQKHPNKNNYISFCDCMLEVRMFNEIKLNCEVPIKRWSTLLLIDRTTNRKPGSSNSAGLICRRASTKVSCEFYCRTKGCEFAAR